MDKIAFIGMGNMGYAMLSGAIKNLSPEQIVFFDKHQDRASDIAITTKTTSLDSAREAVAVAKYIVLAIKPQAYPRLIEDIRTDLTSDKIIISLAPTLNILALKALMGEDIRIVRAMPNTPAMVGEGMTGFALDSEVDIKQEEIDFLKSFFNSFGKCEIVNENLMSAVVAASGSSPAYVYVFIEALADSVVKYGMPRKEAYKFAAQTVLGSAKMVLETGKIPSQLKDNVCSPGGTTIRALEALEARGFRDAIFKATKACYDKCEGLDDLLY